MKIKLPKSVLLALIEFQAKNDIRYYLNGICLYPAGDAAATDGHRMIYITGLEAWKGKENIIISFEQKIPAGRWDYVIIDTTTLSARFCYESEICMALCLVSVVDGRFPDVQRVLPNGEPEPTEVIGFNAAYINAVAKTAKLFNPRFESVKFELYGNTKACVATVSSHSGITAKMVVMPMRL